MGARVLLALAGLLAIAPRQTSAGSNMTMTVVVVVRPPFAIYNPEKEGNEAFTGFVVDLFQEVTSNLGTNYSFVKFDGQGSSEALALLTNEPVEVDMILGDIMITKERLQIVDFTVPFISMPLTVVTRTREARKDVFGFLKPFAWEVWLLLIAMAFAYGIFVWIVERRADSVDFPDSGYVAFREWAWHAAMMSVQDRDKPLKTAAGKVATATYAFVILIVLSAYTANLAATMSSEHIPEVVKGLSQLKSKVGAVYCGGATERFLMKEDILGRVLCKYDDDASANAVLDRSADAAIMNKLQAHYITSKTCGLHVVPGIELDTKPYALPVQKGWIADYAQFNRWLVELVMDGTVDRLSDKWFHGIGVCEKNSRNQLDFDNFYGLGYLLLIGASTAIVVASSIWGYEKYKIYQARKAT